MKTYTWVKNRKNYVEQALENSMTILFSGTASVKSADQDYSFEVDKNFYYLTGIEQENVILAIVKNDQGVKEHLFIEESSDLLTKWNGHKLTSEEASERSGIAKVQYLSTFDSFVFQSFNATRYENGNLHRLYLNLERRQQPGFQSQALNFAKKFKKDYPEIKVLNCYSNIVLMRMYKTDEEIEQIKQSIEATRFGIEEMMKYSKPGLYEYQLESYFDQYIKFHGNKPHAFETIAASSRNATILHYVKNSRQLQDDDLILFDLGCKTNHYSSDISRTFPVNGVFTKRQKEIYQAVLDVNKKCIEFVKPGVTWNELNEYANGLTIAKCKQLGLIEQDEDFKKYYYHSIGHSLGLDTHDPGIRDIPIEERMVLTIEPGLYIEEEAMGVRIEDNILITKDGCINLSASIIKEIEDIEQFMKKNNNT